MWRASNALNTLVSARLRPRAFAAPGQGIRVHVPAGFLAFAIVTERAEHRAVQVIRTARGVAAVPAALEFAVSHVLQPPAELTGESSDESH